MSIKSKLLIKYRMALYAFKCYENAAKLGVSEAYYQIGWLYENGNGVSHDINKAIEYFMKAANKNYSPASYHLGYLYEYGKGVDQDYSIAIKHYQKAAEQGLNEAQIKINELKQKIE